MASKKISNAKENTKKGTKELDNVKEVKNVATEFKYVCDAYKTKKGHIKFTVKNRTFIIMKTSGMDELINGIRSDYVVKEIVQQEVKQEEAL